MIRIIRGFKRSKYPFRREVGDIVTLTPERERDLVRTGHAEYYEPPKPKAKPKAKPTRRKPTE